MIKIKNHKYILGLFILIAVVSLSFFYDVNKVSSAELFMTPAEMNVSEGSEFVIHVLVGTGNETINAVESSINYSTSSLEVVGVNRDDSFIDVWINPPSISREEGIIKFLGGTKNGVGGDLHAIDIRFKALKEGPTNISFSGAEVIAADGEGTSVLSGTTGASISIVPAEMNAPQESGLELIPEVEEEFSQEEESENAAEDLSGESESENLRVPDKPQISVPLYPDQSKWYSYEGPFNVYWPVTEDVDSVGVDLNSDPFFEPMNRVDEICCGYRFSGLSEGVWFVHLRFQNEFGWGETAHHRIGVDYTPPRPFNIDITKIGTGPEINFETHDDVSGVKEYRVFVDDNDPIITTESNLKLSEQPPGEHILRVRAYDMADNFIESVTKFTVLGQESSDVVDWSDNIWIFAIVLIFGIASWFIFRVFNSE